VLGSLVCIDGCTLLLKKKRDISNTSISFEFALTELLKQQQSKYRSMAAAKQILDHATEPYDVCITSTIPKSTDTNLRVTPISEQKSAQANHIDSYLSIRSSTPPPSQWRCHWGRD